MRHELRRYPERTTFIHSLRIAFTGLWIALIRERHLKVHLIAGLLVLVLAALSGFGRLEWIVLILTISLVIVAELMNTAVELTVDLFTRQQKLRAKLAKDVAASAVLVASLSSIVIGAFLFYNKWVGH